MSSSRHTLDDPLAAPVCPRLSVVLFIEDEHAVPPIIVTGTAHSEPQAADYLTTPINRDHLVRVIGEECHTVISPGRHDHLLLPSWYDVRAHSGPS